MVDSKDESDMVRMLIDTFSGVPEIRSLEVNLKQFGRNVTYELMHECIQNVVNGVEAREPDLRALPAQEPSGQQQQQPQQQQQHQHQHQQHQHQQQTTWHRLSAWRRQKEP